MSHSSAAPEQPDTSETPQGNSIIDLEASGFGSSSYPIEVGIVLPNGQTYCSLIVPEPDWRHWDSAAEKIHGIERKLLLEHGRPSQEVAKALNERLRGLTVYSDGWYHDYNWLGRLYDAADMSPSFRLEDLRVLLKQEEADRWQATKAQVMEELHLERHRASNDARVLQQTLLRVQGRTPANQPR